VRGNGFFHVFTGLISAGWLLREVGRRKARKPATEAVNRPHRGFSAGELENPEATFDPCKCLAVFAGQTCLGHLLARGKGVEAFGRNDESLGIFPDQRSAANALSKAAVAS
jgi:hypothetical protein